MDEEVDTAAEPLDLVSQMPELIQNKIFGFLNVREKVQAAQVCSSWKEAVYRPYHWIDTKIRMKKWKIPLEVFSSCMERKIKRVDVNYSPVRPWALGMLPDWSGITCLVMDRRAIPFVVFQKMFCKDYPSLADLRVCVSCRDSPCFHGVFQHLSNLETLSLQTDKCGDLDKAIARNLKKLRGLSLRCLTKPQTYNVESLGQLDKLESLYFHLVTLSKFDSFNSSCKTLKRLKLSECRLGTYKWLEVLSQMSHLEELELALCQPIVHEGLRSLTQGLKGLKVLKCESTCAWALDFNEDGRAFSQMSTLQELSFTGYDFERGLMRVLSHALDNLKSLTITRPLHLGAESMKYIAGMTSLEEVFLKNSLVDGSMLKIISEGSCRLSRLGLYDCVGIRGEDMKYVSRMSSLRELNLWNIDLGIAGMRHLLQGSFRLQRLTVFECGFNLQGLWLLLENQQFLHRVYAWSCVRTKGDNLAAKIIREKYPFVRYSFQARLWRLVLLCMV